MSIHTDRAYRAAVARGAASARTYETWERLMSFSKRELAEIAIHLAALCAGDCYDDAIETEAALERLCEESAVLKDNGLI